MGLLMEVLVEVAVEGYMFCNCSGAKVGVDSLDSVSSTEDCKVLEEVVFQESGRLTAFLGFHKHLPVFWKLLLELKNSTVG